MNKSSCSWNAKILFCWAQFCNSFQKSCTQNVSLSLPFFPFSRLVPIHVLRRQHDVLVNVKLGPVWKKFVNPPSPPSFKIFQNLTPYFTFWILLNDRNSIFLCFSKWFFKKKCHPGFLIISFEFTCSLEDFFETFVFFVFFFFGLNLVFFFNFLNFRRKVWSCLFQISD